MGEGSRARLGRARLPPPLLLTRLVTFKPILVFFPVLVDTRGPLFVTATALLTRATLLLVATLLSPRPSCLPLAALLTLATFLSPRPPSLSSAFLLPFPVRLSPFVGSAAGFLIR